MARGGNVGSDIYQPQLATLVEAPPDGDGWLHEIKYDGYRVACFLERGRVRLITRSGGDWTATFPEIREAVSSLSATSAVIDGEVAILLADGRTSFQALQNAVAARPPRDRLVFLAFDLLRLEGREVSALPLEERKALLERLLADVPPEGRVRLSPYVVGGGPRVFRSACELGVEGIVSKRRDLPYRPGRSSGWLKTKCLLRQELVIGGFTDQKGLRSGLGALLVGYHRANGELVFGGKVGTGFTQAVARDLRKRLERLEQAQSPFVPRPPGWLGRNAHWVKPELVAQVAFREWTRDGKVRQSSFEGLRLDKPAATVVREEAAPSSPPKRAAAAAPAKPRARAGDRPEIAGIPISNPARVVFPDEWITKLDLARYYEQIAPRMLPHVQGRPLTLFRCPRAIGDDCQFMKHSKVWAPAALRRVRIQERTKLGEYLIADTQAALVALGQMDVIEVHTWNSRFEHVEQPDRIVFDLDPGSEVTWKEVVEAARNLRGVLKALGLESFVKTTGGRGLHVVVPIAPERRWEECLAFSRALARAIAHRNPEAFTVAYARAGRERKILIDYLRNNRTNTSVAAFSVRAREGAPVSMPISWDELSPRLRPASFTLRTLPKRLVHWGGDPWAGYWRCRQRLTEGAVEALARV